MAGSSVDKRDVKSFKIQLIKDSLIESARLRSGPDELEFSEIPETLILSSSANYNEERVPGRSEPWKNYADSNPTTIEFSAKLIAVGGFRDPALPVRVAGAALGLTGRFVQQSQPFLGIGGNAISLVSNYLFAGKQEDVITITFQEVHMKQAWLEALTKPQYDDQAHAFPPPLVNLIYGQNFRRRGIVRSVTFEYRGPWEVNTLLCMVINCSISFEELNVSPKGYLDVRNRTSPERGQQAQESLFDKVKKRTVDYSRSIFGI